MPSSRVGFTRRKSDIGATPARIMAVGQGVTVNSGVQVLASPNNSETVYVGYTSDLTANSTDATDGFPLVAGSAMFLPCRHPSDIYVRSTAADSQVIWILGQ